MEPWMLILFILLCGGASAVIASNKNRSGFGFFVLGALFPVIGIVVALLISPGHTVPKGMRDVTCPRCNTRQNVDAYALDFECWQCKLQSETRPGFMTREKWQAYLEKDRAKGR